MARYTPPAAIRIRSGTAHHRARASNCVPTVRPDAPVASRTPVCPKLSVASASHNGRTAKYASVRDVGASSSRVSTLIRFARATSPYSPLGANSKLRAPYSVSNRPILPPRPLPLA